MAEEAKHSDPGAKKKPQAIPIPTALSDRFRVEDQIGQGGFGSVYRVFEPGSGEVYALKVLTLEGGFGRARREIRAARQVQHPRVIRCHEADVLDEHAYFVFELADGSLKELLRYRRKHPDAWDVICDACEGVAALHDQGIVHRDLKPSNILLTSSGGKVADLGLAEVESNNALRRKKEVVGTPQYMSPEQARGEEATPAADVYALAVMAYVCLEGQLPYRGKDTGDTLRQVAQARWRPFKRARSWVSPDLLALIEKALALDPEARPQDVASWGRRLRRWKPDFDKRPRRRDDDLENEGLGPAGQALVAVGVVALGMTVGWVLTDAGGDVPPPVVPQVEQAANPEGFRRLVQDLQATPVIRAAVGLRGLGRTGQMLETWEKGRQEFRKQVQAAKLTEQVRALGMTRISPETYARVADLALLQHLLGTSHLDTVEPLYPRGRGPDLRPLIRQVVSVDEVQLSPSDEAKQQLDASLLRRGGKWRAIHEAFGRERYIAVKNYDWVTFTDPRGGLAGMFLGTDGRERPLPGEVTAPLLTPGPGDLQLAIQLSGWDPSRAALLELVGREESLRMVLDVPEARLKNSERPSRVGLVLQVRARFLPRDLRSLRLGARALQPMTSGGARVGVERVLVRRRR